MPLADQQQIINQGSGTVTANQSHSPASSITSENDGGSTVSVDNPGNTNSNAITMPGEVSSMLNQYSVRSMPINICHFDL